jgi:hypothetical protein
MEKRTLLTICLLLVLTAGPAGHVRVRAQDGPILTVEDASGRPDATAKVNLSISSPSGIGAMDLQLRYDPTVVRFASAETGPSAADALFEANEVAPGRLLVALADVNGLSGDGTLAVLTFDVVGAVGDQTAIAPEAVRAYHYEALTDIPLRTAGGEVSVVAGSNIPWLLIGVLAGLLALIAVAALVGVVVWRLARRRRAS